MINGKKLNSNYSQYFLFNDRKNIRIDILIIKTEGSIP